MSLHMRRIKRNAAKLVIQQQNHIHRRKRKTMWIYARAQLNRCRGTGKSNETRKSNGKDLILY